MSQPLRFHRALEDAGVECDLHAVEGAGHRIEDEGATRRIAAFFDAYLGGSARRGPGLRPDPGPDQEPPTSAPDR